MFHNISYANPAAARGHLTTYLGLSGYQFAPSAFLFVSLFFMSLQARGSPVTTKVRKLEPRTAPARLDTPTDLPAEGVREISAALNALIADTFALYVKTKNFHWHVSGPHFRDYHLLLDEQGDQLAGSIDILAERARKVGGTTIRSVGHIAKLQRIKDNDKNYVAAIDMLLELMNDNKAQIHHMRAAHEVADKHEDVATASLLENFIDEAEKRCWFLFEASRQAERSGH
jgi:starvation-inducible DNA-binding protein